jgi:hypothetical protein
VAPVKIMASNKPLIAMILECGHGGIVGNREYTSVGHHVRAPPELHEPKSQDACHHSWRLKKREKS